MTDPVEIWRGGVNTWECDEMGHMNVRFYVSRFMEGLAGLALRLGLPEAFTARASATLSLLDHHIRFHKEAHAAAPLHMLGGVLSLGESDALLLQVLVHTRTGETCATALTRVAHTAPDGRPFPWPARTREAATALRVEAPAHAQPRSVRDGPVTPTASLAAADRLGVGCAGRGAISPAECDAFGRMRPEIFMGRVSDGVAGLLAPVRTAVASTLEGAAGEPKRRVGGAVLEYRLIYLAWPRVGDHIELRSGLGGFEEKTQRLVHWLLDPVTGQPWGVAEAIGVQFDLDSRKIIAFTDVAREALRPLVTEGLTL